MSGRGPVVEFEGREYPGLAGFTVYPVSGDEVCIRIADGDGSGMSSEAESRWRDLCAANPRLYDGPILAVTGAHYTATFTLEIDTRRSSYRRLAVQNEVETGTDQLSVTAIVCGRDAEDRPHVLLGRRGRSTRIYGGMWELGPSGGITPPPPGVVEIDAEAVDRQVREEIAEEMGGGLRVRVEALTALTYDPIARSLDLVVDCTALGTVTGGAAGVGNWEYHGALWVAVDEIATFDREHGAAIIGPTRALFRYYGWT